MANLGSTNTPAAVKSLDLPNGYGVDVDENSGNLVINDPNGNIVLRWNEGNGEWQLAATMNADGNDMTNVGAFGAKEVNTGPYKITGDGQSDTLNISFQS